MDKKLNGFLIFIFCMFLNPINIMSLGRLNYILLYGIPVMYIMLHYRVGAIKKVKIHVLVSSVIFILLLFSSLIIPIFYGTFDFSYIDVLLAIPRKLLILIFLALLVKKYDNNDNRLKSFLLYMVVATAWYVGVSLIFAVFPELSQMWKNIIGLSAHHSQLFYSYGYALRFGWSGFSGFRNTLDCSIAVAAVLYLYFSQKDQEWLSTRKFSILLSLCFLGNMLYGRIGIIASAVTIVMMLILYRKINVIALIKFMVWPFILYMVLLILVSIIPQVAEWFDWMSTPFKNFLTTGEFDNYSVNHLINDMIFMPDIDTFIFGDGKYVDSNGVMYMGTDSGVMRQLLFWGIIITSIVYLWCAHIAISIDKKHRIVGLVLLIQLAIFEYKGEVYYEYIPLLLVLGYLSQYYMYMENKNIE